MPSVRDGDQGPTASDHDEVERLRAEVDQLRAYVTTIDEGLEPLERVVVDLARVAVTYERAIGLLLRDTFGRQHLEQGTDDVSEVYNALYPVQVVPDQGSFREAPYFSYRRPERRWAQYSREELAAMCEAEGVEVPDWCEEPDAGFLFSVIDSARQRRRYEGCDGPPAGLAFMVEDLRPAAAS